MPSGRGVEPALRDRLLVAALPLSTGAAVLATLTLVHDSLLWPTLIMVVGSSLATAVALHRLEPRHRAELVRRAWLGLGAGVAATVVYDVVRYLAVAVFSWSVAPFGAFPLFGRLLLGDGTGRNLLWAAGIAFHVLNGLGFAIGYALVVPRPELRTAVAWAMVLELLTILLYPNWLGVTAIGELFSMSVLGHLGYGLTLGWVTRRWAP
jgi:hypothetical protein